MTTTNNHSLQFVETIVQGSNTHIVLFYEEPEYA